MGDGNERTCPKCHGPLAQAFVGQHPRRRRFICPKCDVPLEPIKLPEEQKPQNKESECL
jgi:RNase P subunit RPR2